MTENSSQNSSQNSSENTLLIVVITGGTGRTANEVVSSALAQFDAAEVHRVTKTQVRSRAAAIRVVRDIPNENAVILHSLVSPNVREAVSEEAKRRTIPAVDILGPAIAVIGDQLGQTPRGQPGRSYELQKDSIDRLEAVDFTLKHDDGAGVATLDQADVVLVGVSRSSKSVSCFYLAYRGIRAANVPLIAGLRPPKPLTEMPSEKVIALMISPHRLQAVREIRRDRFSRDAMEQYVDWAGIVDELRHARNLARTYGWRTIDVSYMAVEEVAVQVRHMIGRA